MEPRPKMILIGHDYERGTVWGENQWGGEGKDTKGWRGSK
jgi:hypothetical protein